MEKLELPLLKGNDREKCIPLTVIVGLICLVVFFLLASLALTFKSGYKLHYDENSSLNYVVNLKPNDFGMKSISNSNSKDNERVIISSLIDNIDADFRYTFKSKDNLALEYSYYIKATVKVGDSDGKSFYEDTDVILDKKKFNDLSNNMFSVDEKVTVDYEKYNAKARQFINTYGISADSKLVVGLYVDVVGKHADFDTKLSDNAVVELSIPLTTKTSEIKLNYELSNSNDKVMQYQSTIINNPVLFGFAITLSVLDLIAMAVIIIWIIMNRDHNTLYRKKLEKILKDYERYISETVITERVEDMMKTRSLRIEVVKDFEGLIDIRDSLGKPILFHEERPGQEAVFYILSDRVGYIYVMKATDFKKKKVSKKNSK